MTFLKQAALASAGLMFSAARLLPGSSSKKKVIIVGAGAAGLMAAKTLLEKGQEVVLLEARDRVGGRVHTNRDWGFPLELGANWISYASTEGNLGWKYKAEAGIETADTYYSKIKLHDENGRRMSRLSAGLTSWRTDRKVYRYFTRGDGNVPDRSWGEVIDEVMGYEKAGKRKRARLDALKQGYATELAAELSQASGKIYGVEEDPKEDEQLVLNGYDRLLQYLIKGFEVRLKHRVLEIEHGRDRVKVITDQGDFEGDYVIVTVPISLLQKGSIRFNPVLPAAKKQSFQSMQLGLFNKAIMEFEAPFWKGEPHFLLFLKKQLKNASVLFNFQAYNGKPILMAYHIGDAGIWLEKQAPQAIQEHWQAVFQQAYPASTIAFRRIMTSGWHQDPYAQGSYSYLPVGSSRAAVDQLAAPHGRIHFAGEATSYRWHGYVHGALESGLREAKRILEA